MSKVKIQGNASGTGVLTVTAPNTSTDRTITLPDATGTLLNSDGDGSSLTGVGVAGISSSADATAITIDSSERVGIGTTSPLTNSLLHIQSNASSGVSAINNGLLLVENNTGVGIGLLSNNDRQQTIAFGDPQDNDVGFINYGHDTNQMSFNVNASERLRITANGITFNGDTAAANALDDYEEGTWTPALSGVTGTFATSGTLNYTKVGRIVTLNGYIYNCASISNTSANWLFSGLPFAPIQDCQGAVSTYNVTLTSSNSYVTIRAAANNSSLALVESRAGTTGVLIPFSAVGTGHLDFTITYATNA